MLTTTPNFKRGILVILLFLILAITFETSQQLFYLKRFNLVENITFFELLKSQSYQWVIWMILGGFLIYFSKKTFHQKEYNFAYFFNYFVFILLLAFLDVLVISIVQLMRSENSFSLTSLFSEFLPFFIFQKGPMFILGYGAVAIILQLFFMNEKLQVEVQELSEVRDLNLTLYNRLKSEIDDKTTILNIKIGNKRKIIPVTDILWIEADDYCVKVHLQNGNAHSMRSSLKTLDEKLQDSFMRVHRKAIVNMNMVMELRTADAPTLLLQNEQEIPVSKRYLREVKNFISL